MRLPVHQRSQHLFMLSAILVLFATPARAVFINEIHYDNAGTDVAEAVELVGAAGIDLAGWSLVLYNGGTGASYASYNLSGVFADQQGGYGARSFLTAGLQNGAPDGVALVDAANNVIQFLSYEGVFTATSGPATGVLSVDIGLAQAADTAVGLSLQLVGAGSDYDHYTWVLAQSSFGAINEGQTFISAAPPVETVPEPSPVLLMTAALLLWPIAGRLPRPSGAGWRSGGSVPAPA